MIITTANCPSCGGPITFKVGSSVVVICEFCGSAIARTDRDLRNLGKVADLIDTRSPLRVGLEGRFEGRPFVLTGRVQIAHSAGGVWDEWYASFGDAGWGWLAEAQGRFHMTFFRPSQGPGALPPFDYLAPGQSVTVPGAPAPLVVVETGRGRVMGAQGEIPYAVQPGLVYPYADLSGQGGAFGTIDYRSSPPVLFLGREVTLKEMGISAVVDEFDAERREVKVARLTCPHCGGPVALRAPDASLRVTCPSCNSLLDVDRGNLAYLRTLEQPKPQRYPLGAEAVIDGVPMALAGYMGRGCQVEGEWYYWEEYLLYNPAVGFRWIVNGEGGWFFVEGIPPGDVQVVGAGGSVRYNAKLFTHKETVAAVVVYVRGEFYWRVEVGEQAAATDFVSRAETLSREVSGTEVNWSFGRRIDPAALDRAFDPKTGRSNPLVLPPPRVVVPPKPLAPMWVAVACWLLLTLLTAGVWAALGLSKPREVVSQTISFAAETPSPRPPAPAPPDDDSEVSWVPGRIEQMAVVGSFEVRSNRNVEVEVRTEGPQSGPLWLRLVDDVSGETRTESVLLRDRAFENLFDSPGPGPYTLYLVRGATEDDKDLRAEVRVREGATDYFLPVLLSLLYLMGPALLLVAKGLRFMTTE